MRAACSARTGAARSITSACTAAWTSRSGTLSKAMGALGGYVAGSTALIDFLYHRARPFLFSTSHPPSVAATCLAALDVLEHEPRDHRAALGQHALLQEGPRGARLQHRPQREPDHAGDRRRRQPRDEAVGSAVRGRRLRAGHRVSRPSRATKRACGRSSRPRTRKDELQFALDKFKKVGTELGLI